MNEVTGYNLVNVNINVEVHEYIICNYPGVKHVAAATCPRAHTSFHTSFEVYNTWHRSCQRPFNCTGNWKGSAGTMRSAATNQYQRGKRTIQLLIRFK